MLVWCWSVHLWQFMRWVIKDNDILFLYSYFNVFYFWLNQRKFDITSFFCLNCIHLCIDIISSYQLNGVINKLLRQRSGVTYVKEKRYDGNQLSKWFFFFQSTFTSGIAFVFCPLIVTSEKCSDLHYIGRRILDISTLFPEIHFAAWSNDWYHQHCQWTTGNHWW